MKMKDNTIVRDTVCSAAVLGLLLLALFKG